MRHFEVLFYDDAGALDHNGIMTETEARVLAQGRRVRYGREFTAAEVATMSPEERGLPEDHEHRMLTEEFQAFCTREGLPQYSADELLHHDLTPAQRRYVSEFIFRWDAAETAQRRRNTVETREPTDSDLLICGYNFFSSKEA